MKVTGVLLAVIAAIELVAAALYYQRGTKHGEQLRDIAARTDAVTRALLDGHDPPADEASLEELSQAFDEHAELATKSDRMAQILGGAGVATAMFAALALVRVRRRPEPQD